MTDQLSTADELSILKAYSVWCSTFEQQLTVCVKLLLEKKHLYQSAVVDLGDLATELEKTISSAGRASFRIRISEAAKDWGVRDNASSPSLIGRGHDITLNAPDVKLFCRQCKRIEAFNSISSQDFTQSSRDERKIRAADNVIQVFVLSFLCQSCKGVPEVFLVRREGLKLTLSGRAPMEVADAPNVIPQGVRKYYADAIVAHQSGQTLAGLFLLRTLIEQWAQSQLDKPPDKAEPLMDEYMATLPSDFNDRFPSMRALYGDVSFDMHAAVGSDTLFDRASSEIVEHFEARKLFKLIDRRSDSL